MQLWENLKLSFAMRIGMSRFSKHTLHTLSSSYPIIALSFLQMIMAQRDWDPSALKTFGSRCRDSWRWSINGAWNDDTSHAEPYHLLR
jgi:hypothetical protein